MKPVRAPLKPRRDQDGAFFILYAVMLPVMLGMVGLAVDLSMLYARGHELQDIADGAALAAARSLDGTEAGISAARDNARATAIQSRYRFLKSETIDWNVAALSFGATPEGPWIPADAVSALDRPNMMFARVDTGALSPEYGKVGVAFLKVVGVTGFQQLERRAVAGRKDSAIGPLAVCALNNTAVSWRTNSPSTGVDEYVEYGFRRGVGYNLLNLNPHGASAKSYAINPLDFPPAAAVASHQDDDALRPFVCTGTAPAPFIGNGSLLYVRSPFPVSLVPELNSRFNQYGSGSHCTKFGAPPDANIIDFRGPYSMHWMGSFPSALRGSALPLAAGGKLVTIADADAMPLGTVAADYGPLWAFSKPLRFNSATGTSGAAFSKSDWSKLYPVSAGAAPASSYNKEKSPYDAGLTPHRISPAPVMGNHGRRVLHVPLLECPVAGASARVLAIGRFLMTSPASASPAAVHAEFGGLASFASLTASAVLYK